MHDMLSAFSHSDASPTTTHHVVALDLGGTNLRAASIDRDGALDHRTKIRTPQSDDPHTVADALAEAFDACAQVSRQHGAEVRAFAVAVPGAMNSKDGGRILRMPNIKALQNFQLGDYLEKHTGVPVVLENDANAATMGEVWQGAARGKQTAICLTLGTGVGGGLVLDGMLWRGAYEAGGELGHIIVEPDGALCPCGNHGCLEAYVSATAMRRLYIEASGTSAGNAHEEINAHVVYQRAQAGEETARRTFEIVGRYLGIGITSLVNAIDPEIVVIGGGAAAGWDMFIEPLRSEVKKRAFTERGKNVELAPAARGDDAGLLGAAYLAWQKLGGK